MKNNYVLAGLGLVCMMLTGCGAKEKEAEQPVTDEKPVEEAVITDHAALPTTEAETADESVTDGADEAEEPVTDEAEQTDEEWLAEMEAYEEQHAQEAAKRREAYTKVINDLLDRHIWPDGSEAPYDDDLSLNRFSITDIDGDEREELIIAYETAAMAWMQEVIYDYDVEREELKTQLTEFPALIFYSNGIIKADSSHNQSDSDFWPFTLYCYDPVEDIYTRVGQAVAWDRAIAPDNFPESVDIDGDGRVFAVSDGTEYPQDFTVDNAEYEAWYAHWLGENVTETEIYWKPLDKAYLDD